MTLESERLYLKAFSLEELVLAQIGQAVGLEHDVERDVLVEPFLTAMSTKIMKMQCAPLEHHPWYTYWLMVDKSTLRGIGLIGLKGYPDENGRSEVGYGIAPQHRQKRLMTEALQTLVKWADQNPDCRAITAMRINKVNTGSNRVAQNCGFIRTGETGHEYHYELCLKP